jgi:hypothetical protein
MKSQRKGFGITDLEVSPNDLFPSIDDTINQSIARLLGWDSISESYRSIVVDSDGRVLVSTSPTKASSSVNSVASVDDSGVTLLQANSSRKGYSIYNNGSEIVYIRFGNTPVVASGFPIPTGGFISDTVYTGEITAITAQNTSDVRIAEFE